MKIILIAFLLFGCSANFGRADDCKPGWESFFGCRQYQYKLFTEKVTYLSAKSKCAALGGTLAAAGLRHPAVRKKIKEEIMSSSSVLAWIGLDSIVAQNAYVWTDGVRSTTSNTDWRDGEPNNLATERCVHMDNSSFNYKLNNLACSHLLGYLCEIAVNV